MTARDKKGKKKYNPNVTCYKCGKKGHTRPDCRSPKRDDRSREPGKANVATADDFSFAMIEEVAMPAITAESWLADSATTSHVIRERRYFQELIETPGQEITGLGKASIKGRGTVRLNSQVGSKNYIVTLKDALYVPTAPHNLISISRLAAGGGES